MPSSHTALMVGATHGIGLSVGFDSALFALAFAMSMVVIYDATGIRRQAGKHAELINAMINDLAAGNPLKQEQLREVLGHTPMEALGGILLGSGGCPAHLDALGKVGSLLCFSVLLALVMRSPVGTYRQGSNAVRNR